MKNSPVKTIVAIGVGAALFFVLGRFVSIPSPVPNTNIATQYGLLAFMAVMFGEELLFLFLLVFLLQNLFLWIYIFLQLYPL